MTRTCPDIDPETKKQLSVPGAVLVYKDHKGLYHTDWKCILLPEDSLKPIARPIGVLELRGMSCKRCNP